MKSAATLILVCLLAAPWQGGAQDPKPGGPMAETVAQWFDMIQRSFVSLADALPSERWDFAPKSGEFTGVRTFAQQVKHVACANFAFFNEVEHKDPPAGCEDGGPSPARTKSELMTYLRDSFSYATSGMRQLTPAN